MSVTKAYLDELMNDPRKDITWFKDGIEPKMKGFNIITATTNLLNALIKGWTNQQNEITKKYGR